MQDRYRGASAWATEGYAPATEAQEEVGDIAEVRPSFDSGSAESASAQAE